MEQNRLTAVVGWLLGEAMRAEACGNQEWCNALRDASTRLAAPLDEPEVERRIPDSWLDVNGDPLPGFEWLDAEPEHDPEYVPVRFL